MTASAILETLLSYGFRPFFGLVGIYGVVLTGYWVGHFALGWSLPWLDVTPSQWHAHEMLFGFAGGAIGGFLLTAVANWTGRTPVSGGLLAGLVVAWLSARVAAFIGGLLPFEASITLTAAFPILLTATVGREIFLARNRNNYKIVLIVLALSGAAAVYHLDAWRSVGLRAGLMVILILLAVVGGRIIPAFTRNWLAARDRARLPAPYGIVDSVAVTGLVVLAPVWAFIPNAPMTGWITLVCGVLQILRLSRWCSLQTGAESLLWILHVGYAWLGLGLVLLGISLLFGYPPTAGVHALGLGAIGSLVIGMAMRATLGHTGRALTADRLSTFAFVLVSVAAAVRLGAVYLPGSTALLAASAAAWMIAFTIFVVRCGPMQMRPRVSSSSDGDNPP